MKRMNVVSLVAIGLSSLLLFSACNSTKPQVESSNSPSTQEQVFRIGINQLAEHPALDAVREGFEDELNHLGVKVRIDYKNAQGEVPNSTSISQKFVSDQNDLIFSIATISSQTAKQSTSEIPILFSAVTDPVGAGLVDSLERPGANISGTSDASPVDKQLALFKSLDPEIKKIGILFNTGEPNSTAQISEAEKFAKELDLEIVTVGVNNINDLPQAVEVLTSKVDGIYSITDNMIASSINLISKTATEKGLITVGAEQAHVEGGMLITDGLSYEALGRQTAHMAKRVLVDKEDISQMPIEFLEDTEKIVNRSTLQKLELDENHPSFEGAAFIE